MEKIEGSVEANSPRRPLAVVVGGAGYIGSVFSKLLLQSGYSVRVLDRCFFGTESLGACYDYGPRFELVVEDTRDGRPAHFVGADYVVDLAGLSNDPSCALDDGLTHSINVDGGTAVLEAAQAAGVRRYVYQSSCSVYGSSGYGVLDENSLLAPVSDYSRSKVEMENRVLKSQGPDFEVVVSRPGTVFGLSPRMRFDLIVNTMTLAAIQAKSIHVNGGNQWRPLIHAADNARALRLMMEAPAETINGRVFNLGDDRHNYQVSKIAKMVAAQFEGIEVFTADEAKDPRNYRCSFERARTELGFTSKIDPVQGVHEIANAIRTGEVDAGLKTRTVDYYRFLLDSDPQQLLASARTR